MKCDDTPVTAADRRAEEYLRQRIAAAFPDDGILGEELAEQPGTSGFRWILDPIDGTKSFIHGVPLYSTLIGVECEGQSVLGVIRVPAMDECVYAARGLGAWQLRGRPAASAGASLAAAVAGEFALSDERGTQFRQDSAAAPPSIGFKLPPGLRAPGATATDT